MLIEFFIESNEVMDDLFIRGITQILEPEFQIQSQHKDDDTHLRVIVDGYLFNVCYAKEDMETYFQDRLKEVGAMIVDEECNCSV